MENQIFSMFSAHHSENTVEMNKMNTYWKHELNVLYPLGNNISTVEV